MSKFRFVLLLIPILLLQACATAVVTSTEGTAIVPDRRTTGSIIDDQGIEFKVSYEFFNDKEIYDHSHINVTSWKSVV